jgi:hypothetical protein
MKAEELKIGNYVTWIDQTTESQTVLTLTGIVLGDCIWLEWEWEDGEKDNTDCDLESIKGIKITDKWLKDFGATYDPNNKRFWIDKFDYFLTDDFAFYCHDEVYGHTWWLRNIHYVHELQNLFYSLTGEELKIK